MALEIATYKSDFEALRAVKLDAEPVSGGTNKRDEQLIDNIVKRDELITSYKQTKVRVSRVDKALQSLDERSRMILERLYVTGNKSAIDRLCTEMCYDRATVYRLRAKALLKFTLAMYGRTES